MYRVNRRAKESKLMWIHLSDDLSNSCVGKVGGLDVRKQILKGTLILTVAGLITRMIGLYNRVFLANVISAAELGLYQLIFPVLSVCMAVCCYGIESALSKMVAEQRAKNCMSEIMHTTRVGFGLAFGLSIIVSLAVYIGAQPIAEIFLQETACVVYLKIMALSIPFSTLHACVSGYFLGIGKAAIPALSQLIEQVVRVCTIYGFVYVLYTNSQADASVAVWGLVAGEMVSCIFSLISYKISEHIQKKDNHLLSSYDCRHKYQHLYKDVILKNLCALALPMTFNRLLTTVLASLEAVLIPVMLKLYYGDSVTALEIFGVVTGMAFPFVMFPTTLTNALATMLLPAVSDAAAKNDYETVRKTVSQSVHYCILIGILAMTLFFVYGHLLGVLVFKNDMAGYFLKRFSFLCPFIYSASVFSSTLNGLGRVKTTLINHLISLVVRIAFLILAVPEFGVTGYLWGMMAGYLILVILNGIAIYRMTGLDISPVRTMIFPGLFACLASIFSLGIYQMILHRLVVPVFVAASCACLALTLLYVCMLWAGGIIEFGHC